MIKTVFKCKIRFIKKNNKKMKSFKPTLKIYINKILILKILIRNIKHNKDLMNLKKSPLMIFKTAKKHKINPLNLIQQINQKVK